MSRLTIDTGTAGNSATGDSLRTAFTKVNTNFEELYAELGADGSLSDLNFTDNIISTDNTNQNIILSPNGTGLIDVDNRRIINVSDPTSAQDAATKAYVDAQNVAQAITFVGDDSTGTAVNSGETFKIAGSGTVTTAVSGDTITITGATADLGDFTFSGNKLSTTSSNADMELDTAGTGNLVLKSGNFLPATDNAQYLGSASKRWHTLYVGPGSINIDGVILSASGGKLNMGSDIEVNAISSADSSAIQINDAVNISGATHLHGSLTVTGDLITLGRETADDAGSIGMSGTRILGTLELTNPNGNSTMAMGMSFAGASGGEGQMIFEGNNSSGYALVPSNDNQYTLGRPEVAGPGSAAYWKNLYVYNVNFPDLTEQTTAARITVVGDDSTGTTFNAGETVKIAGTQNITTAVSGDILTITGPDLSSYATQSYVDTQVGASNTLTIKDDTSTSISINLDNTLEVLGASGISTSVSGGTLTITGPDLSSYLTNSTITFVGDDSTGVTLNSNETIKIAGTQNITTAVSGDTVTITGPDLSSYATQSYVTSQGYITNSPITVVGDDSTGTTLNTGETIKFVGTQNITTAVSGDTLTITGPDLTNYAQKTDKAITIVGDDSTGTDITIGETFKIAGTQNITTTVSGDTLTITGSTNVNIDTITPSDSSGVQLIGTLNTRELKVQDETFEGFENIYKIDNKGLLFHNKLNQNYSFPRADGNAQTKGIMMDHYTDGYYVKTVGATSGSSHASRLTFDFSELSNNTDELRKGELRFEATSPGDTSVTMSYRPGGNLSDPTGYYTFQDNGFTLYSSCANIYAGGTQSYIGFNYIRVDGVDIKDNAITTNSSNANLELSANGSGTIIANSPLKINAGYIEKINALTSSSTITVNCALAPVHKVTLATNTGFVISNLPTGGTATIIIVQDGTGSRTATFGTDTSTAVKFAGGTPTLSTAANSIDIVSIFNDGTNYYGNIAKAYA